MDRGVLRGDPAAQSTGTEQQHDAGRSEVRLCEEWRRREESNTGVPNWIYRAAVHLDDSRNGIHHSAPEFGFRIPATEQPARSQLRSDGDDTAPARTAGFARERDLCRECC